MKSVLMTLTFTIFLSPFASKADTSNGEPPAPQIPTIDYWQTLWKRSRPATDTQLMGTWHLYAQASDKDCGFVAPNDYQTGGIKNEDGSPYFELAFAQMRVPGNSTDSFAVSIKNTGSASNHEGPYQVQAVEPQFVSLAMKNHVVQENVWLDHACRAFMEDERKMVCLANIKMESAQTPENIACAQTGQAIAFYFEKK